MDAQTWETIKQIGLIGITVVIVLTAFRQTLDNMGAIIKANSEAQKAGAETIKSTMTYLSTVTSQLTLIQKAFEDHTQADRAASQEETTATNKFVEALVTHTKTLTEFQVTTLNTLQRAMEEMRNAQKNIVSDIQGRVEASEDKTGKAITGIQTVFTAQHADQTKDLTDKMNGIQRALEDYSKDTAKRIDSVLNKLEEMTGTLEGLRGDMAAIKEHATSEEERQAALTAFSLKVDGLMGAVNRLTADLAPKPAPSVDVTTDAGTPPPVDVDKKELD